MGFYLFIFVIRENEILIAVIRDSLFFLFVNRARDSPCTTLIEIGLFVKLTYPLSSTTYQILMTKFDYSQLFYHQCNKSLVSLLLWFSFIFGPWYKELYVKASLLKKLTGIHANNCYNFIYLFWTLTHPYNISSSGWTRNYSSMSSSVGRSRDDRFRINDDRILPLRSSLTMLVMRSWMMPWAGLPIWKVWGCS